MTPALAPERVDDALAPLAAGRRRGEIPPDLRERIKREGARAGDELAAFKMGEWLRGTHPDHLTDDELHGAFKVWGDLRDPALDLLKKVGYGAPLPLRTRAQCNHGQRLAPGLDGVLGKLPWSDALRLPATPNTRRSGPNNGTDIYGPVSASHTLRPGDLLLLAAIGGEWYKQARDKDDEPYLYTTAGRLLWLTSPPRLRGGKDIAEFKARLAVLAQLDWSADLTPRSGIEPDDRLRIPPGSGSGIEAVAYRIGGEWVDEADYSDKLEIAREGDDAARAWAHAADLEEGEEAPSNPTIRIRLEQRFRHGITKDTPTFISLPVMAHLRPSAQDLYVRLQALPPDKHEERRRFYLAGPFLYTLGLSNRPENLHRVGRAIEEDLLAIRRADHRYKGYGRGKQPRTTPPIPAFSIVTEGNSRPTPAACAGKSAPRRSGLRRELSRFRDEPEQYMEDVHHGEEEGAHGIIEGSLEGARAEAAGSGSAERHSRRPGGGADADDPP